MGRFRPFAAGAVPVLGVVLAACTDSQKPSLVGNNVAELEITSFPPFAQSEASFELWATFAGSTSPVDASLGKFHINEISAIVGTDWQPTTFTFAADAGVPLDEDGSIAWQLATDAFLTLEPRDDEDPSPRLPALLAGPFVNGVAHLDVSGTRALGTALSSISGSFHLATPTTAATDDERHGIWFAAPGGGAPSLTLPSLPTGWTYVAWHSLLFAGSRSLGDFSSTQGADSDGAGPAAGPLPAYPYPGQDFPWGAGIDLQDGSVFVSIEPSDRRDGEGPFLLLQLLGAAMPAPSTQMQTLVNVARLPTASVTVPFTP